jgi:hypothetical protein
VEVLSGEMWQFEACYLLVSGNNAIVEVGATHPLGSTGFWTSDGHFDGAAHALTIASLQPAGPAVYAMGGKFSLGTANIGFIITWYGFTIAGADGEIKLRVGLHSANTGQAIIKRGSYLLASKVT